MFCRKYLAMIAPVAIGLLLPSLEAAQIGMARLQVADVAVTLLYPTLVAGQLQSAGGFEMTVAPNAQPATGVRNLVVMSHGTGGSASSDHAMAASLVRAGLVVAQPLHVGDNFANTVDAGPVAFERRPREVSKVIDALAASPEWATRLRFDKVGVHGMSAGGVTALALAGAQWSTANVVRHCLTNDVLDEGFCYQGAATPEKRTARKASFESMRNVPDANLPGGITHMNGGRTRPEGLVIGSSFDPRPDTRIAAASLAVPVAAPFSSTSLANIRIPIAVIAAELDTVLLPRFHSDHVLSNCTTCTLLTKLPGAGHFDLLAPWPDQIARRAAQSQVRGGMPEPGFDAQLRTDAFDQLARFFVVQLK